MSTQTTQGDLFGTAPALPEGFAYQPDFIDDAEERALLDAIAGLPLEEARYKDYTARRRTLSYGGAYDFTENALKPAPPVPGFLHPLRDRVAAWVGVPADDFRHALITDYRPGTPIGWHRDTPDFEIVVGVSLAGRCRMRFRPYPHVPRSHAAVLELELAPRSAYVMRGIARWRWQHHIPPTTEQRYSITFRTLAHRVPARRRRSEPTL